MAGLVDLLAPHNFSGGATAIINDLRVGAAYRGAVVLEEFGFPTDPRPRDPSWTEGPLQCAASPLLAECAATAPFFVETNLRALQSGGYAGGSAWMLADMHEKDTATACGDPNKSFALWTGLFAIGGTYCDRRHHQPQRRPAQSHRAARLHRIHRPFQCVYRRHAIRGARVSASDRPLDASITYSESIRELRSSTRNSGRCIRVIRGCSARDQRRHILLTTDLTSSSWRTTAPPSCCAIASYCRCCARARCRSD